MKYWNKRQRVREACWFRIGITSNEGIFAIKQRLQRHDSPGKFFLKYDSGGVWFERREDAVWFALTQRHEL
jgi:hypothetical protein